MAAAARGGVEARAKQLARGRAARAEPSQKVVACDDDGPAAEGVAAEAALLLAPRAARAAGPLVVVPRQLGARGGDDGGGAVPGSGLAVGAADVRVDEIDLLGGEPLAQGARGEEDLFLFFHLGFVETADVVVGGAGGTGLAVVPEK